MAKFTMTVPHSLGQDEAARRLKERFDAAKADHASHIKHLEERWEGNTLHCRFQSMGMKLAGTIAAESSAVRVDAELPLVAAMLKGVLEKRLREELGRLLA